MFSGTVLTLSRTAFAADITHLTLLIKIIFDAVGMLLGVFSVITLVAGLSAYAQCAADDGPGKQKAKNTLATAGMLMVVAGLILLNSDRFSSIVTVGPLG